MGKVLRVCIIGKINCPEFNHALKNVYAGSYVCLCSTPEEFIHLDPRPDVIILLQSYPNEFLSSDVDSIIRVNPLACLIMITSSWCLGERRTGKPVTDVIRVSWVDFPCWFERQKTLFDSGKLSELSLPRLATDAQRAELDAQFEYPSRENDVFWVLANSAVQRNTLSRFYESLNAKVVADNLSAETLLSSPTPAPTRVVLAVDSLADNLAALKILSEKYREATFYALIPDPSYEDLETLSNMGADTVLSPDFYQYAAY